MTFWTLPEFSVDVLLLSGSVLVLFSAISWRSWQQGQQFIHALRASEQKFAAAFRASPDAIFITSMDTGHFIEVSDSALRLTGYTREELIDYSSMEFRFWSDAASRERYVQQLREQGRVVEMEADFRIKSGEMRTCMVNGELIDVSGTPHILGIIRDITELKRKERIIWRQANFDALTKLPNRRMFTDRLRETLTDAKQSDTPFALLLVDLDQFKEVNDTLGHEIGDILLIEVAHRLGECLHDSVTIARLGGDEFSIILDQRSDLENLDVLLEQIIKRLIDPFQIGFEKIYISASIGVARFPEGGNEADHLLRHADQAMYAAKNAGRNRFAHFNAKLQEDAQHRLRLTNDLREALTHNEFEVYYQPIVDLRSGAICKAEALIRWHHPSRGIMTPSEFIAQAEISGLILEIGAWVFSEAAHAVKRWRADGHATLQVSVNVSPLQFRNDTLLTDLLLTTLRTIDLPPQSVVIEITEGLLLDSTPHVTDMLLALAHAGVEVAIDDFGTGYSSLAYLKKFDIDYLKIDRAFVNNLEGDPANRSLCEAIIVMAHKLGLSVIAEGIETAAQRDLLAAAGCDFGQGYLFSEAISAAEFEALLAPHLLYG